MSQLILTIAPQAPEHYSLRLTDEFDRVNVEKLFVIINGITIEIVVALNMYINQGRLRHPQIDTWIRSNYYNIYPQGKPRKIIFDFTIKKTTHIYTLYQPQGL